MKPLGHFMVSWHLLVDLWFHLYPLARSIAFLFLYNWSQPACEALCCWVINYSFASAFQISPFKIPYQGCSQLSRIFSHTPRCPLFSSFMSSTSSSFFSLLFPPFSSPSHFFPLLLSPLKECAVFQEAPPLYFTMLHGRAECHCETTIFIRSMWINHVN